MMSTVAVKGENYDIKVSANIDEQDLVCAVSDFIENIHTIEQENLTHQNKQEIDPFIEGGNYDD